MSFEGLEVLFISPDQQIDIFRIQKSNKMHIHKTLSIIMLLTD